MSVYSSAPLLGLIGVSAGWALFQITVILSGNLAGFLTGQWRTSRRSIFYTYIAGLSVLPLATLMIGAANYATH
jgi:L-rhamnose-H+ transport protein